MGAARRLLGLWLAAALALGAARGCLQCDPAFAARFAAYRPRLSRKSWGLGDVPAAGRLLRGWAGDTVRGLRLSIPAEIPLDKLHEIAAKVYEKLDILLNGKTYQPGILPQRLQAVFQNQLQLLQRAIIESRLECERHCGIFRYDAVSCMNCNVSRPACFGYNCESSEEWEEALKGLFDYINQIYQQSARWLVALRRIPGFLNCTSTSPAMLNFKRIKASMSETWHNTLMNRKTTGWHKYRIPPATLIDC
ncbi:izumo sperm-egg fusion protein 4 [Mauremys reevesii]|uniref:izumo sperm-egg fusion protein 4 n=1 Tax=Mauremys reevesii TaxID=260615 RepID=UPI00193F764F|nr:izumo sperm-egg fusion protein 4 [Mauremys reevesii]